MSKAVFYSGTKNASSWAMRAWLALAEAKFEFEEIVVDIRRPQRFANLAGVAAFSPSATVPSLVVGKSVIFDSVAIMEFANDFSRGALLPADDYARAEARSIVAWQHAGLSAICRRISFESAFYPYKRSLDATEQAECGRLFAWLERLLERNNGQFLFGAVSLADFALAPTVVRLVRHDVELSDWPLSRKWTEALLEHPPVAEWMTQADSQPHIWFDEYLPSGGQPALFHATAR